ncbi:MAG: arylsulfatase [Kiritimatiellales bacterium]|nr:arylsulfatase [Kiritimatiellales bacterium]
MRVFIAMLCMCGWVAAKQQPNILLIQADDLGYCDLGITGSQCIKTPNLDRLGSQSMRFDHYYVHSVCAPTRASLMTGRHFWRTGVSGVHGGTDFMNLNETTIAQVLRNAGYRTGMWGKWHSGKTDGYFPWERGFDEAYMASLYHYEDNLGLLNGVETQSKGWTPAVLTDYAIDFMRRHKDGPFFAYVPYLSPHGLWAAPEEYSAPYRKAGYTKDTATLFGMITHLDHHIGRLLKAVDDLGLRESTLVLFTSDNGPIRSAQKQNMTDEEWTKRIEPMKLRGNKGTLYENGVRSPFFVRWGTRLKPVDNDSLLCVMDIFPTLAEVGGATIPANIALDGKSFRPLLQNPQADWPDRQLFFTKPSPNSLQDKNKYRAPADKSGMTAAIQQIAMTTDRYKLLQNGEKSELFEIRKDPREEKNLIEKFPEQGAIMQADIKTWFNEVLAEPGSFTRPLLLVGQTGKTQTEFPAYCASGTKGGLKNDAHSLDNWKKPGDAVQFDLDVLTAGSYWVEAVFKSAFKEPAEFEVRLNGKETKGTVSSGNSFLSADSFTLVEGRTTLSIRLLTPLKTKAGMSSVSLMLGDQKPQVRKSSTGSKETSATKPWLKAFFEKNPSADADGDGILTRDEAMQFKERK